MYNNNNNINATMTIFATSQLVKHQNEIIRDKRNR